MDSDNIVLGYASPVVGQGFKGEKRAYLVSGYGLKAFDEGYACPGALDPFTPCSGNGVCNCLTGCVAVRPTEAATDCAPAVLCVVVVCWTR